MPIATGADFWTPAFTACSIASPRNLAWASISESPDAGDAPEGAKLLVSAILRIAAGACRRKSWMAGPGPTLTAGNGARLTYFTPSFFCRLDDEVVYWKISFFSGWTYLCVA